MGGDHRKRQEGHCGEVSDMHLSSQRQAFHLVELGNARTL